MVTTIFGLPPPFSFLPEPMSQSALLIIDMINTFEFEGGASLARGAEDAARRIAGLRRRWQEAGAPVIFVNDNFMRWQADFRELVAVCAHDGMRGATIARRLQPGPEDYFVLKPKHSAFLSTPLDVLLAKLEVKELVLTGVAADSCILATSQDAHMREFQVRVPRDCVAAISEARKERALAVMRDGWHVDVRSSRAVRP